MTSLNFDPHNAADTETVSFVGTYSAAAWELKLLASNRDWQDMREMDYDGGNFAGQPGTTGVMQRHGGWGREGGDQQSLEVQFNTNLFDDQVDLFAGVLYFREMA